MHSELQVESAKSPEELMKAMGDVSDVRAVVEAVNEMQDRMRERRTVVETALKDIQVEVESLNAIKAKAKEENSADEIKSTARRMRDKKAVLEKAIRDLEALRHEYNKKLFGEG